MHNTFQRGVVSIEIMLYWCVFMVSFHLESNSTIYYMSAQRWIDGWILTVSGTWKDIDWSKLCIAGPLELTVICIRKDNEWKAPWYRTFLGTKARNTLDLKYDLSLWRDTGKKPLVPQISFARQRKRNGPYDFEYQRMNEWNRAFLLESDWTTASICCCNERDRR